MPDHPMDEFRKWSDTGRKNDEFYIVDEESSFDEHPSFDEYTIGDYFERMALTRSEKTVRVETAQTIKKKVEDFFLFQWDDLCKGWFLTLDTSDDYRNLLFDLYMTFLSLQDDYTRALARRWANEVEDYTEKIIKASPDFQESQRIYWNTVVNGQKPQSARQPINGTTGSNTNNGTQQRGLLTKAEASPDVLNVLSSKRAERIGLNETNVIKNYERHLDLVSSGQYTHTWQTMEDNRVRMTHAAADLQTVPMDEPFHVGGQLLMFPGDTSLGATASETCFCRCIEI